MTGTVRNRDLRGSATLPIILIMVLLAAWNLTEMWSLNHRFKVQKRYEQQQELTDLRRILGAKIDCNKTKAARPSGVWGTCPALPNGINVLDSGGNTSVASSGSDYGRYRVVATCVTSTPVELRFMVSKGASELTRHLFQKAPVTCP